MPFTVSASRYGQRHALELEAARRVAQALGAPEHLVINIDLGKIGGSALTENRDIPKGREESTRRRKYR